VRGPAGDVCAGDVGNRARAGAPVPLRGPDRASGAALRQAIYADAPHAAPVRLAVPQPSDWCSRPAISASLPARWRWACGSSTSEAGRTGHPRACSAVRTRFCVRAPAHPHRRRRTEGTNASVGSASTKPSVVRQSGIFEQLAWLEETSGLAAPHPPANASPFRIAPGVESLNTRKPSLQVCVLQHR
jgi:hypothetical protein